MDTFATLASMLTGFGTLVMAVVTGLHVRKSHQQLEEARKQTAAYDAQLALLKEQLALEYEPKVLLRRPKTHKLQRPYEGPMEFVNVNRLPLLMDGIQFRFRSPKNAEIYSKWMLEHLLPLSGSTLESFGLLRIPMPTSLDGESPRICVYFYYGGTGSRRYRYSATISLIDRVVSKEGLAQAPKVGPYDFC